MKEIFEGIAWLFEKVLFVPYNVLRELELTSWFAANIMNWIFLVVGFAAFLYWMMQLKKYNDNNEEDRDPTAHSFLG
ncbi:MAG: uracil phosphoribosyltransferase [Flavobacteriaceae bacterium]|nr:uracil phosphoribosyltransferase [Flavobacteriaceae bacterium]